MTHPVPWQLSPEDPALDALSERHRRHVAAVWRRRSANERRASSVFVALHERLVAFGADPAVLELSSSAITDELRHAELCAELSKRYDPSCAPPEVLAPVPPPQFPRRAPHLAHALFAALQSSVNETLATGYMGACLDEATGVWPREALRSILRDEVRHARIGWAVLASPRLSRADRANVAGTMPRLLEVCVGAWWAEVEPERSLELPEGYGGLSRGKLGAVIRETLSGVIVPGLEHVGVDPAPARRWIADNAWSSVS
jgi:hypothetical protein